MATAKKLPSGSWRCQVFSHFEEQIQPDGTVKKKRIYKSFTCDDPQEGNENVRQKPLHGRRIRNSFRVYNQ